MTLEDLELLRSSIRAHYRQPATVITTPLDSARCGLYEAVGVGACWMAHFDDGSGNWQAREAIAHHLATHTPIQLPRQPDAVAQGTAAYMQHQGAWRFQPPFGTLPNPQTQMFRPSWPQGTADWPPSSNNNKEWDSKWSELARPMPQLGALVVNPQAAIPAPSPLISQVIVKHEPESEEHIKPYNHSPKEEEREGSENHTASYDVSASQSPSDVIVARGETNREDDHIDVETTTSPPTVANPEEEEQGDALMVDESEEKPTTHQDDTHDEASRLLLNFSQQSFTSTSDEARLAFPQQDKNILEFSQSNNSAFTNPDAATPTTPETSKSFCRPPGLGPVAIEPQQAGQPTQLVCNHCGFSCSSKFHYNSHMNTHGDHECHMCDYRSRTEGRLKKHMRESHTVEEQIAAGLEIEPRTSSPATSSTATASIITTNPLRIPDTSTLSTTMASLVDAANAAAAGTSAEFQTANTLASALSMDGLMSTQGLLCSMASSGIPSALDQIRSLAEKSNLMGEGVNLANALGVMAQMDDSPEKINQNNSEPRRNSNGKIKQLKCKQCPHVSLSKNDQWAHARTHIPLDKQMNCPKCNFVTEYKHHLEYHIRNHLGSKPFQCKKCSYMCVNKSMLNSHMKSHTNVYQFRCMDCAYATKYCHSLKLHLKKYGHRRQPDGMDIGEVSPPSQIKSEALSPYNLSQFRPANTPVTSLAQSLRLAPPIVTSQSLNYASQMLLRQHQVQMEQINMMGLNGLAGLSQQHLKCTLCDMQCASQEDLIRHNMNHIMANSSTPIVSLYQSLPQMSNLLQPMSSMETEQTEQHESESGTAGDDEMEGSSGSTGSPIGSSKGGSGDEESRKRKGFKVDQIGERLLGKSPSGSECGSHCEKEEEHMESSMSPSEGSVPQVPCTSASFSMGSEPKLNLFQQACLAFSAIQKREDWRFQCQHCKMAFQEQALYHIHMGYHGYEHVFKCNRCGYVAGDSLSFNLHLLQASHE